MLVPLSWLREYVDVDLSPQALAEALTLRGLEVSNIQVSGADWTDVVVGRLLSVERHPNADKLWLTTVDVGSGQPLQIVCGADNISVGDLVPVALVGSVLPGDRRIERSKIRGVESQGMLCSAIELGLGDDAEGIHILGSGDELSLGADLRPLVGEVVLDVDVKPNRGDALSMVGLAARGRGPDRRHCAPAGRIGRRGRFAEGGRSRERDDRGPRGMPALRRPLVRRGPQRRVAGVDAAPAARRGNAPDQRGGGRHQLRYARARSADARV